MRRMKLSPKTKALIENAHAAEAAYHDAVWSNVRLVQAMNNWRAARLAALEAVAVDAGVEIDLVK
jgi:hypothetical protein